MKKVRLLESERGKKGGITLCAQINSIYKLSHTKIDSRGRRRRRNNSLQFSYSPYFLNLPTLVASFASAEERN